MSETLLDQIEARLRDAATFNPNAETAPVAILWPDPDGQFRVVIDALRAALPVLTLGDLDESTRTGPAYWLRCAIAGTIELPGLSGTPIVYLPGVARSDLRAVESCPRALAPIAELQYRGNWFAHHNGKDWTVRALLGSSERGLGLDVAEDSATNDSLKGALAELLAVPVRRLNQRIDAEFLQRLLNPDPAAKLLEWLDDPIRFREANAGPQWDAFVGLCRTEFGFDPAADGELSGGRLLGLREGSWSGVWQRFAAEPERFPGIEDRLRKGRPGGQMSIFEEGSLEVDEGWPQDNEKAEKVLGAALEGLADSAPGEARAAILRLEAEHRNRRNWVWARLDRAPLAFAIEHLARLAELTTASPASTVEELQNAYAESGWRADDAFLAALAGVEQREKRAQVAAAGLAVYRPWLDLHARALQEAIGPQVNAGTYPVGPEASTDTGTVTVFVDGFRLDLAHRLIARLGGLVTEVSTTLAALPTVTDTAKPVLTPVPPDALSPGKDLGPVRASSSAKASISVLRGFMGERGGQILEAAEMGDPSSWAWTEALAIDSRGHNFGLGLVDDLDRELDDLAKRIRLLLEAGWTRVEVVTDHGWLLIPGGMERVDLPASTVELKKGRCARLKDGADVSVPTVPWHWDPGVRIALAPGISCFEANKEYEHGGVSLQECVVPRVAVTAGVADVRTGGAAITKVKWLGLMCRVEYENVAPGATVDIRALPADSTTSVGATTKETTTSGKQSLHIEDEDLQGETAYLVIVGSDGRILAQRDVTIGVNT
jgi:hypothetical protein